MGFVLEVAGAEMHLGIWWLDAAVRGALPQLPIVNRAPQYVDDAPLGPQDVDSKRKAQRESASEFRTCFDVTSACMWTEDHLLNQWKETLNRNDIKIPVTMRVIDAVDRSKLLDRYPWQTDVGDMVFPISVQVAVLDSIRCC